MDDRIDGSLVARLYKPAGWCWVLVVGSPLFVGRS
jgi:hypothetical protein